jgi:hypothetical protein
VLLAMRAEPADKFAISGSWPTISSQDATHSSSDIA